MDHLQILSVSGQFAKFAQVSQFADRWLERKRRRHGCGGRGSTRRWRRWGHSKGRQGWRYGGSNGGGDAGSARGGWWTGGAESRPKEGGAEWRRPLHGSVGARAGWWGWALMAMATSLCRDMVMRWCYEAGWYETKRNGTIINETTLRQTRRRTDMQIWYKEDGGRFEIHYSLLCMMSVTVPLRYYITVWFVWIRFDSFSMLLITVGCCMINMIEMTQMHLQFL